MHVSDSDVEQFLPTYHSLTAYKPNRSDCCQSPQQRRHNSPFVERVQFSKRVEHASRMLKVITWEEGTARIVQKKMYYINIHIITITYPCDCLSPCPTIKPAKHTEILTISSLSHPVIGSTVACIRQRTNLHTNASTPDQHTVPFHCLNLLGNDTDDLVRVQSRYTQSSSAYIQSATYRHQNYLWTFTRTGGSL